MKVSLCTRSFVPNSFRQVTADFNCTKNFPFRRAVPDVEIPIAPGTGDEEYLAILQSKLPELLATYQPDLVLYDAGVDVHDGDRLGKLALSYDGIFRRDRYVLETCAAASIPVATVIGGGYSTDHQEVARRHSIIVRAALAVWQESVRDSSFPVRRWTPPAVLGKMAPAP